MTYSYTISYIIYFLGLTSEIRAGFNEFCYAKLYCLRWIPDGQLCPTVPNRSNYIHWIEDLLSSEVMPKNDGDGGRVRGFDIGIGANCIYPLLGASLLGWSFVGSGTDIMFLLSCPFFDFGIVFLLTEIWL